MAYIGFVHSRIQLKVYLLNEARQVLDNEERLC